MSTYSVFEPTTRFQHSKSVCTPPLLVMRRHDQRQLPSFQAAVFTLRRLQAAAAILPKLVKSVHAASRHVLTELGHAFFVPLMLTLLSILARIWVSFGDGYEGGYLCTFSLTQ